MTGSAQQAEDVEEQVEDDAGDSGASFSVDGSGVEDNELRSQWFPLRPSAVGEDDEDTSQASYTASAAVQHSNSSRPQSVPQDWSDDDAKQSPPERSQPDGRDGPDLKRTPWGGSTYASTQQTVTPPVQNQPLTSGTADSKDSGSDTSLLSQPQNDNVTPLDIITRSVPPAPRGAALVRELRQRHAPQLNSDSDTESPVSKLLGPNFRAVQQVLDRLKQDKLTNGLSDEAEDSVSEQQSLKEESLQSLASTESRTHGTERNADQPGTESKTHPSADAATSTEFLYSRPFGMLYSSHSEMHQRDGQLRDTARQSSSLSATNTSKTPLETGRASSWTSTKSSYRDVSEMSPSEAILKATIPAAINPLEDHSTHSSAANSIASARSSGEDARPFLGNARETLYHRNTAQTIPQPQSPSRYSTELRTRSSIENSLRSSRIAWGDHTVPVTDTKELLHRKDVSANAAIPSSAHASKERLHELSPRSSIGSSVHTFRTAWPETKLPTSLTGRELAAGDPIEEMPGVIPADNLVFPGQTSSVLLNGTNVSVAAVSSLGEKSNDSDRTERNHKDTLEQRLNSDMSASSDDTDDLLTYEPVFEGNRQYLQMQRRIKHPQQQSNAVEHRGSRLPMGPAEFGTRISGQEQPPPHMVQTQEDIQSTPTDLESQIKALHWSLGAGTISPISFDSAVQLYSQQEKSSTPLGPAVERSNVHGAGALQEQSLEEDDTTAHSEDRDAAPLKQPQSHSTTDISSSDEMYRPVLYGDVSANKENRPDESVLKASSFGIYDIRRSSGPGSTNRRRKALGLQPNPARDTFGQDGNELVYISGSSTQSSVHGGRGRFLKREEDPPGRHIAYGEEQPDQHYHEGRSNRNEEHKKLRTKEYELQKQADVPRNRQDREVLGKRDFQDLRQEEYLAREKRASDRSHRHQLSNASSKDSIVSGGIPEDERGPLRHTSDRSRQHPSQYMDTTDPNRTSQSLGHSKRSVGSGKSRTRYAEDGRAPLSQQSRLDKTSGSKKHSSRTSHAKTGHSSRNKSDSRASKASRLDANITRLSALISRSLDESVSSSSQASTTTSSRRQTSKGKKAKLTSSTSESSDVSEYFNYAFFEPRLRPSIGQKIKLRELLRSVKSRDLSPIVRRTRDSTSPESTSGLSSNDGQRVEREPPPAMTEPQRSEPVQKPTSYTSEQPASGPRCTCARLQRAVTQATSPGVFRKGRKDDGKETEFSRKRDVGVNFPTPAVTRHPSPVRDEVPPVQLEDASTQTDEVVSGGSVHRKIATESEKSLHKPMKSKRHERLLNVEERGVISQPSPKKSDHLYNVEQRETRHKPKERLIPSQNSPDHSVKTGTDWRNRAQEPAWFYPLTGKPQTEQRTTTQITTPNKSRTRDEFRVDVFETSVNPSSSLQKLSLQEAFLYARPKFVKRSQERVARIEEAAREKERRRMLAEAAEEEKKREEAEAELLKARMSPVTQKSKPRTRSGEFT